MSGNETVNNFIISTQQSYSINTQVHQVHNQPSVWGGCWVVKDLSLPLLSASAPLPRAVYCRHLHLWTYSLWRHCYLCVCVCVCILILTTFGSRVTRVPAIKQWEPGDEAICLQFSDTCSMKIVFANKTTNWLHTCCNRPFFSDSAHAHGSGGSRASWSPTGHPACSPAAQFLQSLFFFVFTCVCSEMIAISLTSHYQSSEVNITIA